MIMKYLFHMYRCYNKIKVRKMIEFSFSPNRLILIIGISFSIKFLFNNCNKLLEIKLDLKN